MEEFTARFSAGFSRSSAAFIRAMKASGAERAYLSDILAEECPRAFWMSLVRRPCQAGQCRILGVEIQGVLRIPRSGGGVASYKTEACLDSGPDRLTH